jgi:hypothetical protein
MGLAGELSGRFDKPAMLLLLGRAALGSSEAGENFRIALGLARETADQDIEAAALAGLGHVALIAHEDQAGALNDMGDVARAFGNHETACGRWREALAIYLEIGMSFADLIRAKLERYCLE